MTLPLAELTLATQILEHVPSTLPPVFASLTSLVMTDLDALSTLVILSTTSALLLQLTATVSFPTEDARQILLSALP
jgi:hypothetical protein